jgi:NAD(P)-dependent dehydrogenase (short-subunit alcohol dehydrogenase family)
MKLPNFKNYQLAITLSLHYRHHQRRTSERLEGAGERALNGDGLDLLINNAGVLTPGPMEVLSLSAVRREFEVNVYGSLATINAFLPLLRQAKGRIVQIGSMTGRFPLPFSGAVECFKSSNGGICRCLPY